VPEYPATDVSVTVPVKTPFSASYFVPWAVAVHEQINRTTALSDNRKIHFINTGHCKM